MGSVEADGDASPGHLFPVIANRCHYGHRQPPQERKSRRQERCFCFIKAPCLTSLHLVGYHRQGSSGGLSQARVLRRCLSRMLELVPCMGRVTRGMGRPAALHHASLPDQEERHSDSRGLPETPCAGSISSQKKPRPIPLQK